MLIEFPDDPLLHEYVLLPVPPDAVTDMEPLTEFAQDGGTVVPLMVMAVGAVTV